MNMDESNKVKRDDQEFMRIQREMQRFQADSPARREEERPRVAKRGYGIHMRAHSSIRGALALCTAEVAGTTTPDRSKVTCQACRARLGMGQK